MKLFAYVALLVAILVGLAYAFKPAEAPPAPSSSSAGPAVAAPVVTTSAASIPAADATTAAPSSAASQVATATPRAPDVAGVTRIDLVYAKGRLVAGPTVVKVKQNDHVSLSITSDTADELHLHGINLHLRLTPRQTATLDFVATKTGRFTYELHRADVELGAIEVYPR